MYFFTKNEQISLDEFLKLEENKNSPRILCPFHKSAKCIECNRLNNQDSLRDIENRNIIEENMTAIKLASGKFKLLQKMEYYENPTTLYTPQNSNRAQAESNSLRLYKKNS